MAAVVMYGWKFRRLSEILNDDAVADWCDQTQRAHRWAHICGWLDYEIEEVFMIDEFYTLPVADFDFPLANLARWGQGRAWHSL